MSTGKKQKNERLDHWAERIAEQRASGLKVRDWCAEQGVTFWEFQYWRRQAGRAGLVTSLRKKQGTASSSGFRRVTVSRPAVSSPVEIVLPSGAQVRLQGDVDRQTLRLVLEEVGRC